MTSEIRVSSLTNRSGLSTVTIADTGVVVAGIITATSFSGPIVGVVTATSGTFSGNVSIGGTLTYEDVTNIDSVGIITAQTGIDVTGGHIDLVDNSKIRVGTGEDLQIYHNGSNSIIEESGTGNLGLRTNSAIKFDTNGNETLAEFTKNGSVELYYDNSKKFETINTGAFVSGNLGIGTTNPTSLLNLSGSAPRIKLDDTAGSNDVAKIFSTGGILYLQQRDGTSHGNFVFRTEDNSGAVERVRINSNGRVAIGTPSDTDHTLCVAGTDDTTSLTGGHSQGIQLQNKSTTDGTYSQIEWRTSSGGRYARIAGIQDDANGNGGQLVFLAEESDGTTTERLRIASDGKIGISNASPLYSLHLKNAMGSSPSWIHMEATGSNVVGGGNGIAFDTSASNNASSNGLYLATIAGVRNSSDDGSNDLVFSTSKANVNSNLPTEKLRINPVGAIGLGGPNYGTTNQVLKSQGVGVGVTWQNIYSFMFYGEQDTHHGVANAVYTAIVNLGARDFAVGDSSIAVFNEDAGTLTIGANGAGYWFLSMGAGIDDVQANDYTQCVIGKNGTGTDRGTVISSYSRGWNSGGANQIVNANTSCMVNLSANDVVRFYVYHNEGTNENTEPNRSFAMGYKIT